MTSNFISVNNINLHYVEEGRGPLVILLHGFPEFWYGWRKQIPVLSKKYRVVALDMRGYNLSDKPENVSDYKIEILASDIKEVIKNLGAEKAIVAGHDWGAAVAWAVASIYPEVVSKLAILNVPHPAEMKKAFFNFNLAQWRKSYYIFFFQLPLIPEKYIGKDLHGFFTRIFSEMRTGGPATSSEEIMKYVEAYAQPGALTATINYYRAALRNIGSFVPNKRLKMPVLMLWGEQDTALGKELTYHTSDYCENLEVIYDPTSGHFIQHDNPGLVNEKLLEFFSRT